MLSVNQKWDELMVFAKSVAITKRMVWDAYLQVKRSKGGSGYDRVTMEAFEENLQKNLYKLWNRLASGSYFPPPVLQVDIPKADGGVRRLGIPTISDRIAQTVVKQALEPQVDPHFLEDSYGYRPGKSAFQALAKARERCWKYDWVLDLDIKGFFDTIDHDLLMAAVRKFTNGKWMLMYIERWLKADLIDRDGNVQNRSVGTPQGGVISPLLSNIFLHFTFDKWMEKSFPDIKFERYADDIVAHCNSREQTELLQQQLESRLNRCKLALNKEKTKIVYCKDANRKDSCNDHQFDFLGYTFRPRLVRNNRRIFFVSFSPAMSAKAAKRIRMVIKKVWNLKNRITNELSDLAKLYNPAIQGWLNYYGKFHGSKLYSGVIDYLNTTLMRWAMKKYKLFRKRPQKAGAWLKQIQREQPTLFAHWKFAAS
jgi:RNA-directed DNA polymerase